MSSNGVQEQIDALELRRKGYRRWVFPDARAVWEKDRPAGAMWEILISGAWLRLPVEDPKTGKVRVIGTDFVIRILSRGHLQEIHVPLAESSLIIQAEDQVGGP